jgi:hypothetical protein
LIYRPEELLVLVKELSDIYTGKESTSITYEVAQQLMDAVLYCINENDLINEEQQTNGIISNSKMTAREAYDNGYRLVTDKIKRANDLYNRIIIDFNAYNNRAYYDTVIKGMPEFFKWYDPRLNPMDHLLLVDYTVLENINGLNGIDFIYRYLICIEKEQRFLRKFPEEYIRDALLHFHTDYEELFFNVCALIIKRILVNMLLGVRIEKIKLEQDDYRKLSKLLSRISIAMLEEKLYSDLKILIINIYSADKGIYNYLSNEIPNIVTELKNAADNNCLCSVI